MAARKSDQASAGKENRAQIDPSQESSTNTMADSGAAEVEVSAAVQIAAADCLAGHCSSRDAVAEQDRRNAAVRTIAVGISPSCANRADRRAASVLMVAGVEK